MAENNEYWVNEDGDANIYTVLKGNKTWIAKVQLNGEMGLERQREIMANMVADLNYDCSTNCIKLNSLVKHKTNLLKENSKLHARLCEAGLEKPAIRVDYSRKA